MAEQPFSSAILGKKGGKRQTAKEEVRVATINTHRMTSCRVVIQEEEEVDDPETGAEPPEPPPPLGDPGNPGVEESPVAGSGPWNGMNTAD